MNALNRSPLREADDRVETSFNSSYSGLIESFSLSDYDEDNVEVNVLADFTAPHSPERQYFNTEDRTPDAISIGIHTPAILTPEMSLKSEIEQIVELEHPERCEEIESDAVWIFNEVCYGFAAIFLAFLLLGLVSSAFQPVINALYAFLMR